MASVKALRQTLDRQTLQPTATCALLSRVAQLHDPSAQTDNVARVLNEHFIAVKVDREERPDVNEQFMLATQIIGGRGDWPNSVWLTPDGKPWISGTYFPRARFINVLQQLTILCKTQRPEVAGVAR